MGDSRLARSDEPQETPADMPTHMRACMPGRVWRQPLSRGDFWIAWWGAMVVVGVLVFALFRLIPIIPGDSSRAYVAALIATAVTIGAAIRFYGGDFVVAAILFVVAAVFFGEASVTADVLQVTLQLTAAIFAGIVAIWSGFAMLRWKDYG